MMKYNILYDIYNWQLSNLNPTSLFGMSKHRKTVRINLCGVRINGASLNFFADAEFFFWKLSSDKHICYMCLCKSAEFANWLPNKMTLSAKLSLMELT